MATISDTIIQTPSGYPYVLLAQRDETGNINFFTGNLLQEKKAVPVSAYTLYSQSNRERTHHFLKHFGNEWVLSQGRIFFKEIRKNGASSSKG